MKKKSEEQEYIESKNRNIEKKETAESRESEREQRAFREIEK